ncbi:class F sortase [Gordonia zhaorongruii]|uniref:class F sortase n=1 Tax=Gordonia zhaorongruii TaxID=2597659 RepID=UPI00104761D5|nr:class F sortase [Gordonia zhaorongruii]
MRDRTPTATIRAVVTAVAATAALLVGGCGSDPAPISRDADAQSQLAAPVAATSTDPSSPARLTAAGGSASIDPVATDTAGALLPPQDVARLGWWVDSSLPGSGSGVIVITGHVDDVDQGRGFAARFTRLNTGDAVTLTAADGHRHDYRVSRTALTDKQGAGSSGLPVRELNRQDGPETLALVTCGGPFVGPPLGYRDNVVVFAVPA